MNKKRALGVFSSIVVVIAIWSVILQFYSAQQIVQKVGLSGYWLFFAVAAIGGASTLTATSYFTTLITLANGGLNPFILGLIGGVGISIGDSIFYYVGTKGRSVFDFTNTKWSMKSIRWINERPRYIVPILTYLYAAFVPLPNDILMIILALTNQPYKRIILPLLLGNITISTTIAYLAVHSSWIVNFLS